MIWKKVDSIFIAILFNASIVGVIFPDLDYYYVRTDFFENFIGHRSILTHSILIPSLLYFYLKIKKKLNNNFSLLIIGLFLGLVLHLIADIYPKNGYENISIKLPGNISIEDLSTLWIFLNIFMSFYFSKMLLNKYYNKKHYRFLYLITGSIIAFIYVLTEPSNKILIYFTFMTLLLITYFYDRQVDKKLSKLIRSKN